MLRRWAAWVASVLGQRDTVARELRPAGRPSRGVTDRQHKRDRCLYWATWRQAPDGPQVRVSYDITGEGRGFYLRPSGPPVILYRWDSKRLIGSSLTRDGVWRRSEGPQRNLYLGSDYGHPVSVRTAREIAEELGTPNALEDYEVHPVTPR
jgi:hypothetical protein